MTSRPIIMSAESIREIFNGTRRDTRCVVAPQPNADGLSRLPGDSIWRDAADRPYRCPYGQEGTQLWVREVWADVNTDSGPAIMYSDGYLRFCQDDAYPVEYERYPGCQFTMWCGDLLRGEPDHKWRYAMQMQRWASRLTLEVESIRVERWDKPDAELKYPWKPRPWAWVITFKRAEEANHAR